MLPAAEHGIDKTILDSHVYGEDLRVCETEPGRKSDLLSAESLRQLILHFGSEIHHRLAAPSSSSASSTILASDGGLPVKLVILLQARRDRWRELNLNVISLKVNILPFTGAKARKL